MGCFNEQRTGKTPTSLVTLDTEGHKKILIVTVASAIFQWRDEFERWTGRPCIVVNGTKSQREKQIESWTDGLVISYDSLKEITKAHQKIDNLIIDVLGDDYDCFYELLEKIKDRLEDQ